MPRDLLVRRRDLNVGAGSRLMPPRVRIPSMLTRGLGAYCAATTEKVVALTYDDGPDPDHTPRILDVLQHRGATATFFVLGQQVERHPDIARRIVADGHEIGLHGYDHRSLLTMAHSEVIPSLTRARREIESAVGAPIRLFRPPYGSHTPRQAYAIQRAGMDVVLWSGVAEDWLHDDERAIADRALAALRPGAILLFHDTRADPETLGPGEVLPAFDRATVLSHVLDGIDEAGFRTETAGGLLDGHVTVRSLTRR